jgi:hypothetical protein
MEPHLQNGHTVFIDNWFTSPSLFLNLAGKKKTNAVGTVRVNRKNMPQQFRSTKMVYSRKMMALQWMDRKTVTILFMFHSPQSQKEESLP